MNTTTGSLTVALLTVLAIGVRSGDAASYVLQDTFEDDTVSAWPNGPEIGAAIYGGGADHQVVGIGGGGKLLYSDDDGVNEEIAIEYTPMAAPAEAEVSYEFMIQGGATLGAIDSVGQLLTWDDYAVGLALWWGHDWNLYTREFHSGTPIGSPVDTGFDWSTATSYEVTMQVSAAADTVNCQVNGTPVLTDYTLGADVAALTGLYFGTGGPALAVQRLDDVLITPEPSTLTLAVLGVLSLTFCGRRKRRRG